MGSTRAAAARTWWSDYKYLPEPYVEMIAAEADAARITHFQPLFIPGLLQTRAYAIAVTPATTLMEMPAGKAEALVEARMRRQRELLDGPNPVELTVLIDETVLYRRVGSSPEMRAQLDHLIGFIGRERVRLAIIPRTVDMHPGMLGAFMLLEYPGPDSEDVLCFDGQLGNTVVRSPELAAEYRKLASWLLGVGLTGEEGRDSILAARESFA